MEEFEHSKSGAAYLARGASKAPIPLFTLDPTIAGTIAAATGAIPEGAAVPDSPGVPGKRPDDDAAGKKPGGKGDTVNLWLVAGVVGGGLVLLWVFYA